MYDSFWNFIVNVLSVSDLGRETQGIQSMALENWVNSLLASSLKFNGTSGELYYLFFLIGISICCTVLKNKQIILVER